jgi:hypothetical protein
VWKELWVVAVKVAPGVCRNKLEIGVRLLLRQVRQAWKGAGSGRKKASLFDNFHGRRVAAASANRAKSSTRRIVPPLRFWIALDRSFPRAPALLPRCWA